MADEPPGLRVQIVSDIHLESCEGTPVFSDIVTANADVLALLGDISALGVAQNVALYEDFLRYCCEQFSHVLVLAGNHEYYTNPTERMSMKNIDLAMDALEEHFAGLTVLRNSAITLEGVRILGCTLWTHVPPEQTVDHSDDPTNTVEYRFNDYRAVFVDDVESGKLRPLEAADTNALHSESRHFLEAELRKCTHERVNALVLTHHTPSFHGTANTSQPLWETCLRFGESTDLEHMMRADSMGTQFSALHTWAFGHTHYNCDLRIGHVRVVANQRGYENGLAPGFQSGCVVSVPCAWTDPEPAPDPVVAPEEKSGRCLAS